MLSATHCHVAVAHLFDTREGTFYAPRGKAETLDLRQCLVGPTLAGMCYRRLCRCPLRNLVPRCLDALALGWEHAVGSQFFISLCPASFSTMNGAEKANRISGASTSGARACRRSLAMLIVLSAEIRRSRVNGDLLPRANFEPTWNEPCFPLALADVASEGAVGYRDLWGKGRGC